MSPELKQRLVGATVLIILGIVILPMLLDRPVGKDVGNDVTSIQITAETPKVEKVSPSIPPEVLARYEKPESTKEAPIAPRVKKTTPAPQKLLVKPKKDVTGSQSKQSSKASANGKGWAVQMGSFSSKENAERLVQRMKSNGMAAYFERTDSSAKVIFRVRVGPFDAKEQAEKVKQKLDMTEKLNTLVLRLQ